jgi:class 3 adenylate cyclase
MLSLLGAALLLGGGYFAFLNAIWLPTGALVTAWIAACVVTAVAAAFAERAQRAILMRLFSIYASAPIAKDVWRRRNEFTAGGRPIPLRLTATVLASDINDFTTVSEVRDPEIVARWINLYMEEMTALVDQLGGMVENFAGDGLMAVWGAPIARTTQAEIQADGVAAVRCALRMATALDRLNSRYRQEGLPEMRIGVGLYSGELIGCSLGSSQRQQYSTIGDTTNTAARLVTVAKDRMKSGQSDAACQVVIGETTFALLGERFITSALGSFPLKGKSQAVACYLVEGEVAPGKPVPASARSP